MTPQKLLPIFLWRKLLTPFMFFFLFVDKMALYLSNPYAKIAAFH